MAEEGKGDAREGDLIIQGYFYFVIFQRKEDIRQVIKGGMVYQGQIEIKEKLGWFQEQFLILNCK